MVRQHSLAWLLFSLHSDQAQFCCSISQTQWVASCLLNCVRHGVYVISKVTVSAVTQRLAPFTRMNLGSSSVSLVAHQSAQSKPSINKYGASVPPCSTPAKTWNDYSTAWTLLVSSSWSAQLLYMLPQPLCSQLLPMGPGFLLSCCFYRKSKTFLGCFGAGLDKFIIVLIPVVAICVQ